jgi:hypothetical protein
MMSANDYLQAVLAGQTFEADSEELKQLREKRAEVEAILRGAFPGADLTIRFGGSKAKNTMIRESYDLDVISYFGHEETVAGETLEAIYNSVKDILSAHYVVEPKTTALRLYDTGESRVDFHIDVVPGRFTDDKKGDTFLYQPHGPKKRLKTNLQVHIEHVRDSGLTDTIKLVKLWKVRNGVAIKGFILELLVIEVLAASKGQPLEEQLLLFWKCLRDEIDNLTVEDPANPHGNDLSELFDLKKPGLKFAAEATLQTIEQSGWEAVFGEVDDSTSEAMRAAAVENLPRHRSKGTQPWAG